MRLGEIMSEMGLSGYAEVALIIFFVVFVLVTITVFSKRLHSTWDKARYMPLDDGPPANPESDGDGDEERGTAGGDEP